MGGRGERRREGVELACASSRWLNDIVVKVLESLLETSITNVRTAEACRLWQFVIGST